jgi:thiol-disulfide isomerase/thioredoxin
MRSTFPFGTAGRLLAAPLVAFVLLVALPACAQQDEAAAADAPAAQDPADGNTVVGRVQGQQITLSELEASAGEALTGVDAQLLQCQRQAEQSRFQVLQSALQEEVQRRLVAAEAEKAGQTPEAYVAAELESKLAPVTDADVEAFYNQNKARIGSRPKEQVGPQIRSSSSSRTAPRPSRPSTPARREVRGRRPARAAAHPGGRRGPVPGPENAPVTIVEFSDFECPFCSRVIPTLKQVKENYGDKVRLVFRQFPLNIHANAQKAAEASLCADDQGKFWELHDLMFAEQTQLTSPTSRRRRSARARRRLLRPVPRQRQVRRARCRPTSQAGMEAGVSGTPAMFINGIPISGAVPYEQLAQVIDAELARAAKAKGGRS